MPGGYGAGVRYTLPRAPSDDPSRNLIVHGRRLERIVLSAEVLVDCNAEFSGFLETMDILGPKLGPIVFQFPLFQRNMILRNLRRSTYSSRFSLP